jgi:hypothetical protein
MKPPKQPLLHKSHANTSKMDLAELPPSPTPSCSSRLSDTEKRVLEPAEDDHESLEEGEIPENQVPHTIISEDIQWCSGKVNSLTVTKEDQEVITIEYCTESGDVKIQTSGDFTMPYDDFVQYLEEVSGNYRKKQLKDEIDRIEEERENEFEELCFYTFMVLFFGVAMLTMLFIAKYV